MGTGVQDIVQEIRRYLKEHPQAAETARGVAGWWLAGEGRTLSGESVQKALDELMRLGVMEVQHPTGGEDVYRAARGSP